ncbi:mechanosensitive ion channel family protein [Candidatus Bathyarchaeota archaeon]|nr:mechanosensitive ion channel family protein [Candidatus Bathyarchaeota archaeon]
MADFNLTQTFMQILGTNSVTSEVLASLVLFVFVALVGWAIYFIFNRYVTYWAQKTKNTLDDDIIDVVKSFIVIAITIIGIEFALSPLSFLQPYRNVLDTTTLVVEVLLTAFALTRVSNVIADWYADRAENNGKNRNHLVFVLKKVLQAIIFTGAIISILWVKQFDLTGAMVGLGVGGIAVAFALQSTLSDFFSAFSIYFDRPFEIGDFITIGQYSGTVNNIGIKSTRLKLLSGEELVVSNKELTNASVRNFRKLEQRRVLFTLRVTYDTKTDQLKQVPFLIKDVFDGLERAKLDRVHFTEYGDFALKFEIVYFVNSSDYREYLDIQQYVNLGIKEVFEREGIKFAYPTSTVYLKEAIQTVPKKEPTFPIAE